MVQQRNSRRHIALIGIAAILFQALLLGWHHHPLEWGSTDGVPTLASLPADTPLSPDTDEDRCEICAALHFLSAAPGEFITPAIPAAASAAVHPPARLAVARSSGRGFQARAPPVA